MRLVLFFLSNLEAVASVYGLFRNKNSLSLMSYRTNSDNVYQEGTIVSSKTDPESKLVITKYYQRIYYCTAVNEPGGKELAFFEREIIASNGDS